MQVKGLRPTILVILSFALIGCATTTGPVVMDEEMKALQEELEVKALLFRVDATKRLIGIGTSIIRRLPEEDTRGWNKAVYTGLVVSKLSKVTRRAFHIDEGETGLIILGVVRDSPAEVSGLKPGDVIMRANGRVVNTLEGFEKALREDVKPFTFEIKRGGEVMLIPLTVERLPADIGFQAVDAPDLNAFATPEGYVIVTYGMLRFVRSDDELAVVVGHEIAHLTKRHIIKSIPSQILAVILGVVVESKAPGAGEVTMRAVHAPFSREFEREADYVGLLYAHRAGFNIRKGAEFWERFAIELPASMTWSLLSTHPSSPERMLRLRKVVEGIEGKP